MLATMRVFLLGAGCSGRLMLVLLCFVWLSLCIFTPASSHSHPSPSLQCPGTCGEQGLASGRGAGAGTLGSSASLASPPPRPPSCSVTGSDGRLPGCVASLSVSSCSDPLAGWLRKKCALGKALWSWALRESSLPLSGVFSPYFPDSYCCGSQWGVGDPCAAGPQSVSGQCLGEEDLGLPCPLLWRPLPVGRGTSRGEFGRGWAQRRMSDLGGQEANKLDRK